MLKAFLNLLLLLILAIQSLLLFIKTNPEVKVPNKIANLLIKKLNANNIFLKNIKITDKFEITCDDFVYNLGSDNEISLTCDKLAITPIKLFKSTEFVLKDAKVFYKNNAIGASFVKITKCGNFLKLNTFGNFLKDNLFTLRTEFLNIDTFKNSLKHIFKNNQNNSFNTILNSYNFSSISNIFITKNLSIDAQLLINRAYELNGKAELYKSSVHLKNTDKNNIDISCFIKKFALNNKIFRNGFAKSSAKFKDENISLKNTNIYGNFSGEIDILGKIKNCEFLAKIKKLKNPNNTKLSFFAENAEFSVHSINTEYFTHSKNFATNINCIFAPSFFLSKIAPHSMNFIKDLSFSQNIYSNVKLISDAETINAEIIAETSNAQVGEHKINKIYSVCKFCENKITAKTIVKSNDSDANIIFKMQNNNAMLILSGILNPYISKHFNDIFPNWWAEFWANFEFYKKYPTSNVIALFNTKDKNSFSMFGAVGAKNFKFANISLENFSMKLGNIQGLCFFDSKNFKTHSGYGSCKVFWPYSIKEENLEKWLINGTGKLSIRDWNSIIDFFSDKNITITKIINNENVLANVIFNGEIFGAKSIAEENKPLNIALDINSPNLFGAQFDTLTAICAKTNNSLACNELSAKIAQSEISGNFTLKENDNLSIDVIIKDLDTKHFLQSETFVKDTLKYNHQIKLKPYYGTLNAELNGYGKIGDITSFYINGYAKFKGEKIAKIHLLGPLSNLLLSRKIITQSTIKFNEVEGAFELKNAILTTENVVASSNSSRANIKGAINLQTSEVEANMDFHFFDHKKMNVPILKQLFQLLQPISKGFKASLSGTFITPK